MLQTSDQARQVGRDKKKNKVKKKFMVDDRDGRGWKKCMDDLAGKGMKEQVSNLMVFGDTEESRLEKRKKKKRKKNKLFVGNEEQIEEKETKKKKRNSVIFFDDEERGVEDRKEGVSILTHNKGRICESMKQNTDIIKVDRANGERKKRMEKDIEDDTIASIQELKKAKGKKKNKRRQKSDLFVGYEEQLEVKETKKKKRAYVTFFGNEERDIIKVNKANGEGKKRMGEDTEDDTIASTKEQKKVKRKKKNKNETSDDVKVLNTRSENKAETLRSKERSRVKMKLPGGEVGKKPGCKVQNPIGKDSSADSSKLLAPESLPEEVKSFPPGDSINNFNSDECGLVRGKRFSKEEDEIIKKAVAEYIEANRLGEKGLNMILHPRSNPKVKGCWNVIAAALPWRPKESVNKRAHMLLERGERKWTPEELQFVMETYEKHGPKWRMMADKLGKFRIHVKEKWRMHRLINRKKGKWSQDEYQALFQLVHKDLQKRVFEKKKSKHGMLRDNISWNAISDELGTRTHTCCCHKWYHQLSSPMVAEGTWADVDDYRLLMVLVDLDASCEDEVEWDILLEHRLGVTCQKRWQQMVRHIGEHGNKSFPEQVEVLSRRYCPDLLQIRETFDSREVVD